MNIDLSHCLAKPQTAQDIPTADSPHVVMQRKKAIRDVQCPVLCLRPALMIPVMLAALAGSSRPAVAEDITDAQTFEVGIWIQDLYGLNVKDKSFSADIWLWARGITPTREPLKTMRFVNMLSSKSETGLYQQQKRGEVHWSQRLLQGTFRHDWNVQNFPFDRHRLQIVIDEGLDDTSAFRYIVDTTGSDYSNKIKLSGWRITDFTLDARPTLYNTTFGNPVLSYDNRSLYPELVMSVEIQRDEITSFLKLIAILYIAFGLSLLSYLLHLDNPSVMSPRVSLVVGAVFASAINMRAASSTLGSDEGLTLVDQLHIAGLILIACATFVAVLSRLMLDAGRPSAQVKRFNYFCCAGSAVTFAVVNAALILMAIQRG